MTNFERIKNMSVEEMAKLIYEFTMCELNYCGNCILKNYECNQCGIIDWLLSADKL